MTTTYVFVVVLALCAVATVHSRTVSPLADYDWQQHMDQDNKYLLSWKVDNATVSLRMQVQTTGWVAFGIGEQTSGSMAGSDMVVAWISGDGTAQVSDRFATAEDTPPEDDCQDWSIVSASQLSGVTTIEVTRDLVTGDTRQDRDVVCDIIMRVVWAYAREGFDDLGYHGQHRGFTTMQFCGVPVPEADVINGPGDGATAFEFKMPSFPVPSHTSTYYACLAFSIPGTVARSLIQVDPIVHPASAAHVHHFVLATNNGFGSTPTGTPSTNCGSMGETFYAWASGMEPWVAPNGTGFPVTNGAGSFQDLVIQVHYDNPDLVTGVTDESGVRMWMTTNVRPITLAMLQVGDGNVNLAGQFIPTSASAQYDFTCNSGCTNAWPHSITVVSSFLHMHIHGRRMWTSLYNSTGDYQRTLGQIDFWDNDRQSQIPLGVTINPGDQMLTTCVYDTTTVSTPVKFGLATEDEMCIDFLLYYPASPDIAACQFKASDNCTQCSAIVGNTCAPGSVQNNPAFTEPASLHPLLFGATVNYACPTLSPTLTVIGNVDASSSDSVPIAAVAGAVVAVVVAVGAVACYMRRKRADVTSHGKNMEMVGTS